jgi:glycosyltransferase involved in cell wall biosynthesis
MKVAVVHDWLVVYGGAERVLEHILDCYPEADLFSLIDAVPPDRRAFLRGRTPRTSFLQGLPGVGRYYRKLLPLMPLAIEQLDLSGYDLVISSSHAVAKGVLTGPGQLHVCYCHSPMRYAWDHYFADLRDSGLERGPLSWFARWQLHRIRTWDVRSSFGVDRFIANSHFVRERIFKVYRRYAQVVYPPIETGLFHPGGDRSDFYVATGRFVPYKRMELIASAFKAMPSKQLVLIGDGPGLARAKAEAGPNVVFLGHQPLEVLRDHLQRARAFIFPPEEDFGIVPLEAQACGTPVIAFGRGGALETVISPERAARTGQAPTGIFFEAQTGESLCRAVAAFERMEAFDPEAIAAHARGFGVERFKREFQAAVAAAWTKKQARALHSGPDPGAFLEGLS